MNRSSLRLLLVSLLLTAVAAGGCAKPKVQPDYARPLAAGERALRLVPPDRMPDLATGFTRGDAALLRALDESVRWFDAPSSRQFFPFDGITHERARASVVAFRDLAKRAPDAATFATDARRQFDVYESVGYNGQGIVLFTGYYSPEFHASLERTARFKYPLYRRPADLVTDKVTGEPRGRKLADGRVAPYPARREIESTRMLAGSEIAWLEDSLSAYLVHVNGSAKLRLPDGSIRYLGYAGKTDRPYASLGKAMIEARLLRAGEVDLPAIRRVYRRDRAKIEELMNVNESYVFFTESDGARWPAGSLGVPVTAQRSLATDKKVYPRGGVLFVNTNAITLTEGAKPFRRFMLDQDTGGAIRAPGRADIFMGIGTSAEILAGGQSAEGRLYYLFLKPDRVASP